MSGFAVEFASHREYVAGDDPKHIDWRLYFTRDRYFIKQYEMETNFVCHFMLDASASMLYGEDGQQKLSYATQMIARWATQSLDRATRSRWPCSTTACAAICPPATRWARSCGWRACSTASTPSTKRTWAIPGRVVRADAAPRDRHDLQRLFHQDLTALESALQQLRYRLHEVVLFQVMHHDELVFENRPHDQIRRLEIPEEFLAEPESIRKNYLKAMNAFNERLDEICSRNRIERVLVDTSRDMAEVLIDYLNHRSRVHGGR